MEKEFRCRDLGNDCDFVACGKSEEELLDRAADHAKLEHKMKSSHEIYDRAGEAVHDVLYCDEQEGDLL
jgi:predicted small metal-binding protein